MYIIHCNVTHIHVLIYVDGACEVVGSVTTAHLFRVVKSAWNEHPVPRPKYSAQEKAYKLVKLMESGELTDTEKFVRDIQNAMAFIDLPT